jgi:N-acetylglucosaminyldiphosphoundecaprenol N-acetyl-beta-D-mannosaminyltransferase
MNSSIPAPSLLPRAPLRHVLTGRAPLVGARVSKHLPRGLISPVEARHHLGIPYGDPHAEEHAYLAKRSRAKDLGVAARALAAAALAPAARGRREPRPFVVAARVDNLTIPKAIELILAHPREPRAKLVYFVHAHALNLASFDDALAARLARADVVLPDGIGIRLAARMLGVTLQHNINGTDLLPLLCREAAARGIPLSLIGGAPGVADDCAARLIEATPGLRIPLTSSGFLDDAASAALAARVRGLGRSVVLVGMGSPRQEAWAEEHLAAIEGCTALTVGGLFDFFSGRIPRAPLHVRELGLEWAYRLAQEPSRLARRYLLGNPLFLALALKQRAMGPKVA